MHDSNYIRPLSVCKRWRNISKKSWQNVKTLDRYAIFGFLGGIYDDTNQRNAIEKVLQRCGSFLRHLDLSSFSMKSYILHSVGNLCPNLQYLNFQSIILTRPAIKILTKNCHNLKEVAFGDSTMACDDTPLAEFFSQNKQLQSLKIAKNMAFTGECFLSLPVDMHTIIIEHCSLGSIHYVSQVSIILKCCLNEYFKTNY